jgi:hypothetical protein
MRRLRDLSFHGRIQAGPCGGEARLSDVLLLEVREEQLLGLNVMENPREPSPELLELARQAVERQEAEKRKLAAMTPEQRKAYIDAWAKRLASEQVEELSRIARENGGCDCGFKHG